MTSLISLRRPIALVATIVLAFVASSTLLASTARASSLGLYFDYAFGPVDPDVAVLFGTRYDTRRISAGLGVDTAVAKDKLFNYRMNLGYENVRERFQDVEFARFHQGSFENVFGFGVYRSERMRVWLGPTLRIAAGTLDEDSVPGGGPIGGTIVNLTAGGGLAAGVNVHTGDVGSAAFTIGYQYAYQGRFNTGGSIALPSYLQGRDQRVNFNFAYFFRGKGDRFEK